MMVLYQGVSGTALGRDLGELIGPLGSQLGLQIGANLLNLRHTSRSRLLEVQVQGGAFDVGGIGIDFFHGRCWSSSFTSVGNAMQN